MQAAHRRSNATMSDTLNSFVSVDADEAFGSYDKVEPSRLSKRVSPPLVAVEEPEGDDIQEEAVRTPQKPNVSWLGQPSVTDQANRFPTTVKYSELTTEVLDLGEAKDLARLNIIQSGSHPDNGPTLAIAESERQFYNGRWFMYITYAKISYQKI